MKTLVDGICAYTSYSPAKILPPDAASYCAPPGAISVNFGPHRFSPPIYRCFAYPHTIPPFEWHNDGSRLFSFRFTTWAPPFCVTETHSCTMIRWLLFRCDSCMMIADSKVVSEIVWGYVTLCYDKWINYRKRIKYFHFVSSSILYCSRIKRECWFIIWKKISLKFTVTYCKFRMFREVVKY